MEIKYFNQWCKSRPTQDRKRRGQYKAYSAFSTDKIPTVRATVEANDNNDEVYLKESTTIIDSIGQQTETNDQTKKILLVSKVIQILWQLGKMITNNSKAPFLS